MTARDLQKMRGRRVGCDRVDFLVSVGQLNAVFP